MCEWIKVTDRLPTKEDKAEPAILIIPDNIDPLLLWDAYDDTVGEVHIGGYENGKFYTHEEGLDDSKLNITHWQPIKPPVEE
jgi:hypothetical protein